GWAGHEHQWRGNYEEQARRESDLEILFTSTDPLMTDLLLEKYHIAYVYIGPLERQKYPQEALDKFTTRYPVVYQNSGVAIYRVDGEPEHSGE
ncbi:MAG: hypothetical protein JXB35_16675, partial [Anaerolineae bacterium]|nr:hypothetical protein [Anaerolineae bacterium]